MLNHRMIPISNHPPHTHGVEVLEEGPFQGVIFVFGKIEFLGEDKDGLGRFLYDYELIKAPKDINTKALEVEIGPILDNIIKNSSGISEIEDREREIEAELQRVAKLPQETIMTNPDGSTVELIELLPE